jgi:protein-disulfide isomerase
MRRFAALFGAFVVFTLSALGQTGGAKPPEKSALDKAVLEDYVRHLFVWGPQIQVKVGDAKPSEALPGFREVPVVASAGQASQAITFYVSPDGRRVVQGTVFDITLSPFKSDAEKIKTDLQPSFGTPGAPVVVVVYSDFQCSFCKEEAKLIRQTLAKEYPKDVRVYFKDFPLEAIHPWAKPAAMAGRCVFRQKPAAFWDYHDWIFEKQGEVTPENLKAKVEEFGKTKGLEPVQLAACIDNKATEGDVDRSMAEARALNVNSTPTLFVNGRRVVGNVPWQQLKQIVDHEIEYAKTHGGGEKCCELTLPSPVKP